APSPAAAPHRGGRPQEGAASGRGSVRPAVRRAASPRRGRATGSPDGGSARRSLRRARSPRDRRSRASGRRAGSRFALLAAPARQSLAFLELLERLRPVAVEQLRQRAVGEETTAGL